MVELEEFIANLANGSVSLNKISYKIVKFLGLTHKGLLCVRKMITTNNCFIDYPAALLGDLSDEKNLIC